MKQVVFLYLIFTLMVFLIPQAFAKNHPVTIPFGAYDPTFNTPVENWFEPPIYFIEKGDSVTWTNDDREGHTVTSGVGPGRFGWMGGEQFGEPDGYFDRGRFHEGESWSFTFDKTGLFSYYCTIHPWMEGVIFVGESIPDYPHDATGKRIDGFPLVEYTEDGIIEIDITWEPNVIKTNEKVAFIYHTYDPSTNSNLDKIGYEFILIQNGEEIFRDKGITGVGGDYRNYIFNNQGPITIRFENVVSWGTSGIESSARAPVDDPSIRTIEFSTMVYENPEEFDRDQIVVQPAKRVELQYELLLAIILIPGGLAVIAVLYMMYGKGKISSKSSAI